MKESTPPVLKVSLPEAEELLQAEALEAHPPMVGALQKVMPLHATHWPSLAKATFRHFSSPVPNWCFRA